MSELRPARLSVGQCATLAVLLEVTAPKPGNVHRGADFEDATFIDFAAAAVAIGPVMERAAAAGVGPTVLDAVRQTRLVAGSNTNLGTILLLAPLATVPRNVPLPAGVADVLQRLSPVDAQAVYEAIRLARPGGLEAASNYDVHGTPPQNLLDAMRHASSYDQIAQQYVQPFKTVLTKVADRIEAGRQSGCSLTEAIVRTHVELLADEPDSLIARKCGAAVAEEASARAARVLDAGDVDDRDYLRALADFDFWLRSDRHRRNPGSTADLIAAGLFVLLRDQRIAAPYR